MSDHMWLDSVAAYALGALDAAESEAFESHLTGCERCAEALRQYRATAAALAGATERTPPAGLRDRILAAAGEEAGPDSESRADSGAASPVDLGAASSADPSEAADVTPIRPPRPVLPWLVAAAAGIAAVAAGYYGLSQSIQRDTYWAELAGAREQLAAMRVEAVQRDSVLSALAGSRIETATLVRTEGAPEPRVRLFWNRARSLVVLTAFDLPPAARGRTYQLWGIAPGRDPVSFGVFDTDANGTAVVVRSVARDIEFAVSAVSDEPEGGSPQPTTTPFLAGEWGAAQP